jgi:hypothetical protein
VSQREELQERLNVAEVCCGPPVYNVAQLPHLPWLLLFEIFVAIGTFTLFGESL